MMEKEELQARVETTESFSIKLEQILPWQDGQYAEVFLGIRDYDEISAKMSEEVKNSLLYHLGTHIQKHLKGQEMVCHVKKDEFLLLLDNHVEAASEKIGHIMIMFEAMIGDKCCYGGVYSIRWSTGPLHLQIRSSQDRSCRPDSPCGPI